jgi:hypothetical protein
MSAQAAMAHLQQLLYCKHRGACPSQPPMYHILNQARLAQKVPSKRLPVS